MISDYRCFFCFAKAFEKLLDKENISVADKNNFTKQMNSLYFNSNNNFSAPAFSRELHIILKSYSKNPDPYKEIKKHWNDTVLQMYPELQKIICESDNPFNTALRLAIAGNIIDFAVGNEFNLDAAIKKTLNSNFAIDHSSELKKELSTAKSVLYLGDNAGEIVFDKLFIETINHPNVIYTVRGAPVINDATY